MKGAWHQQPADRIGMKAIRSTLDELYRNEAMSSSRATFQLCSAAGDESSRSKHGGPVTSCQPNYLQLVADSSRISNETTWQQHELCLQELDQRHISGVTEAALSVSTQYYIRMRVLFLELFDWGPGGGEDIVYKHPEAKKM
jgi:hypothetical protein